MPEKAQDLVDYFDQTYINSTYRYIEQGKKKKFWKLLPHFKPEVWNVHENMQYNLNILYEEYRNKNGDAINFLLAISHTRWYFRWLITSVPIILLITIL